MQQWCTRTTRKLSSNEAMRAALRGCGARPARPAQAARAHAIYDTIDSRAALAAGAISVSIAGAGGGRRRRLRPSGSGCAAARGTFRFHCGTAAAGARRPRRHQRDPLSKRLKRYQHLCHPPQALTSRGLSSASKAAAGGAAPHLLDELRSRRPTPRARRSSSARRTGAPPPRCRGTSSRPCAAAAVRGRVLRTVFR